MRRQPNVFDDLGFSPEEAAALTIKAELHTRIVKYAKHYSQAQLQEMLGEPQPRISDLLRGKMAKIQFGSTGQLRLRPRHASRNQDP